METRGGLYLSQIKQLQDRIFERMLQQSEIEISGSQGRILFVLWKSDRLTIGEIGLRTALAKNTVSIVVDGMVKKGIVEREVNPNNRRQSIISLTEYSKSMQGRFEKVSQQMNKLFYKGFSKEEQEQMETYLKRIRDTLVQHENE